MLELWLLLKVVCHLNIDVSHNTQGLHYRTCELLEVLDFLVQRCVWILLCTICYIGGRVTTFFF